MASATKSTLTKIQSSRERRRRPRSLAHPASRVRGATVSVSRSIAPESTVHGAASSASKFLVPAHQSGRPRSLSHQHPESAKRRRRPRSLSHPRPESAKQPGDGGGDASGRSVAGFARPRPRSDPHGRCAAGKRRCPAAWNACSTMNWSMWCFVTPWKRPQRPPDLVMMSRLPSTSGAETRWPLVRIPSKSRDGLADLEADAGVQRCRWRAGVRNPEPGTLRRVPSIVSRRGSMACPGIKGTVACRRPGPGPRGVTNCACTVACRRSRVACRRPRARGVTSCACTVAGRSSRARDASKVTWRAVGRRSNPHA